MPSQLKKLRLLLFEECNRNCSGCCNKDWDLKSLPIITDFHGYDEILLTGGEPMLMPFFVIREAKKIKQKSPTSKIYLYTAKIDQPIAILAFLNYIDGITLTLHHQSDIKDLIILNEILPDNLNKSFRLNVFKKIKLPQKIKPFWKIKNEIKWIKDCPLPKHEIFGRLK